MATNRIGFNTDFVLVNSNIGIGTTNPSQKLHVQGNVRLTGALYDSSNLSGSSGQILSSTESAIQWINASSANVGSANSIAIAADSTNASRYLTFVSTTSGNNVVYVDNDLLYNPSTNSLAINGTSFTGTASQNLQVTGGAYVSGNLGIGTTNPSVKLQVGGTIGFNDSNIKIGDTNTGCSITSGTHNFFAGASAGRCNTTGSYNNFFGNLAGCANTTGGCNNFFGHRAGLANTTGSHNNFLGLQAGASNTIGGCNIAIGYDAGYGNTSGSNNIFFGFRSGFNATGQSGCFNFFAGRYTGCSNTTGSCNVFIGPYAGRNNTTGSNNNLFGYLAGGDGATNNNNNFFGYEAGRANISGSNNNFLGNAAGRLNTTGTHNNFLGFRAGFANTTGCYNNFFGSQAGNYNTIGSNNNFFGRGSGFCNTTGSSNNFLGTYAGCANTTGNHNNFFGSSAGRYNTTGSSNFIAGCESGRKNTTGSFNNFLGQCSGYCNTTGCFNNFFGVNAGFANTTGLSNNFFGGSAGYCNTTGCHNNFFGGSAGYCNTTGSYNSFFGRDSGICNTTGNYNNFIGNSAGRLNTTGTHNNFFGNNAGRSNTTGSDNFFGGYRAGFANINGNDNNFIGRYSGGANTTGCCNNFLGRSAGCSNTTGVENTFLGTLSGFCNITGNDNIFLGAFSGISTANSSKVIVGTGFNSSNLFDAPDTTKDRQLAIGSRNSTSASQYWIVGDENFNVGIGTTNPSQKLHVQGNARLTGALYDGSNSAGSSGQILSSTGSAISWINPNTTNVGSANSIAITLDSTNASRYLTFVSTTSGNNVVYVDSDLLYNPSTNSLGINTTSFTGTSSQTLQVTGGAYVSGNLGIGITNPTSKLQVQGDVSIASTVGIGTVIDIVPYDTLNNGTLSWEGSAGQLFSITNNLTSGSIFSVNDVSGIPSIDVDANGTIQLAPYGGNIGVGTTNPATKLHVIGTIRMSAVPGANNNASQAVLHQTASGDIDGGSSLTFNPADDALSINGMYINTNTVRGNASSLTLTTQNGSGTIDLIISNTDIKSKSNFLPNANNTYDLGSSSNLWRYGYYNGAVFVGSGTSTGTASQTLQVTGGAYVSGNVGIGTINPNASLEIVKSQNSIWRALDIKNTGTSGITLGSNLRLFAYDGSSVAALGGLLVSGSTWNYGTYLPNQFSLVSTGSGGVSIAASIAPIIFRNGNADVDFSPEKARFDVSGNLLISSATATGTVSQPLQVTGGAYVSGNLGIGITNPGAKLQVTPTSTGIAGLFSGTTSSDMVRITQLGTGNALVVEDETNPDSSPFVITGIGSVGVGTANPQYKLHVVGDFGATTKSFVIPHPTKPGMTLRHGSLEGPENGVYVRGKTTESIIPLPDYWTGLVDEESITVNLTPKNGKLHSVVGISSNTVEIECVGGEVDCYFMILGERKDVAKLVAEY